MSRHRLLRFALSACAIFVVVALCSRVGGIGPALIASAGWIGLAGSVALLLAMVGLGIADASLARRRLAEIGAVSCETLDELTRLLDVPSVVCLDSDVPVAVCAGACSPLVFISRGLVGSLSGDELAAVLLHEHAHRRRRDPLRRALRHRWARTMFFIPLAAWWDERARTGEEIAADAAAVRRCGPRPVARALLIAGGVGSPGAVPAFGGSPTVRIRRLAGDSVSLGVPSLLTCLQSVAGAGLLLAPLLCFAGMPSGL
ncbi:MAG: M56 family metallopeptidase [Candidatus Dormibacteraeota bacterium]|uniref:M56 family metallopeptidase n=1 Tax=Candidatus Amunia macphersoniae TaxID=3127014 RepID=A0A934KI95_9BACT|nr:M56 family metallopeptidase [Candidatus Dormibacteraeota bacterium]